MFVKGQKILRLEDTDWAHDETSLYAGEVYEVASDDDGYGVTLVGFDPDFDYSVSGFEPAPTKTEVLVALPAELKSGDVVVEDTDQSWGVVKVRREVPVKPALPTENGTIIRRRQGYNQAKAVQVGGHWRMVNSGSIANPDEWQDGWEVVPAEPDAYKVRRLGDRWAILDPDNKPVAEAYYYENAVWLAQEFAKRARVRRQMREAARGTGSEATT